MFTKNTNNFDFDFDFAPLTVMTVTSEWKRARRRKHLMSVSGLMPWPSTISVMYADAEMIKRSKSDKPDGIISSTQNHKSSMHRW